MTPGSRHGPSLAAVLALAARQHGLVTRAQLLDAGLSPEAIRHRRRTGRIHTVHPGVFAVGRPELTREGRMLAAVLACGEGAALSHLSAAVLWGIWDKASPARPHVSVPTGNGRRGPPGIELHRTATLRTEDVTERYRIPVTTLTRTLLDTAPASGDKGIKSMLRQCERLHRLDLNRLRTSLDALPPSDHRRASVVRVLEVYVPRTAKTDSQSEADFLELCARHGIPLPETQVPVGPYRADFMWPDLGLVVEVDDRSSHDGYVAFQEDRVRDRTMQSAGLEVLRFTRNEVLREPSQVAAETRAARTRRAARTTAT